MEVFRSFGGGDFYPRKFTVHHAATSVVAGALVMRGATAETDKGMAVVGAGALVDSIGVLLTAALSSVTDSNADGTAEIRRDVAIAPAGSYLIEYSQAAADDVDVTSSAGTTITVGSLEDDIDGGFIMVVNSDRSNRELRLLTASASGSATMKSALTTALTSADHIIKILPRFHQLAAVNTAATMLTSGAAAGSARVCVVENYIQDVDIPLRPLDPIKDSPRTLTSRGKLFAEVTLINNAFFPFD